MKRPRLYSMRPSLTATASVPKIAGDIQDDKVLSQALLLVARQVITEDNAGA